jgi:hypothetical protein
VSTARDVFQRHQVSNFDQEFFLLFHFRRSFLICCSVFAQLSSAQATVRGYAEKMPRRKRASQAREASKIEQGIQKKRLKGISAPIRQQRPLQR